MTRPTILAVEDENIVAKDIQTTLINLGHKVRKVLDAPLVCEPDHRPWQNADDLA